MRGGVVLQTMSNKPLQLVVLQNGRRVSKTVHTTQESAEHERNALLSPLQESVKKEAAKTLSIKPLLFG